MEPDERSAKEERVRELRCEAVGCGRTWDTERCLRCLQVLDGAERCPHCSEAAPPADRCPFCGSADVRTQSLEEYVSDPVGVVCSECDERPAAGIVGGECPACGEKLVAYYEPIPWLPSADLQLVFEAAGRIATDENGVPLDCDMENWLRRHGVTDSRELYLWEEWLHVISAEQRQVANERLRAMRQSSE